MIHSDYQRQDDSV